MLGFGDASMILRYGLPRNLDGGIPMLLRNVLRYVMNYELRPNLLGGGGWGGELPPLPLQL